MLTKGGHTTMAFLEELAAEIDAAGGGRGPASHNGTNPDAVFRDLDANRSRRTRAAGASSARCRAARCAMDFTLRSPYTFEGLESWQPALPLKGAAYEAKLEKSASGTGPRGAGAARALSPVQRPVGQGARDRVARRGVEQRPVGELAREAGADPLDYMLDLALEENLSTVLQRAAAQLRRGGRRQDAAPSGEPGVAFRRRRRTSPSSTMPASACTCSATGCASAAR